MSEDKPKSFLPKGAEVRGLRGEDYGSFSYKKYDRLIYSSSVHHCIVLNLLIGQSKCWIS